MLPGEPPHSSFLTAKSALIERFIGPIHGSVEVPGSKSVSNRAILLAAFAEGSSELTGVLQSDDTRWCLDAAGRLGAGVGVQGTSIALRGIGRRRPVPETTLHVGSAGTVARFLPGLLAAGGPGEWTLTASEQMMRRPVAPLLAALAQGGGQVRGAAQEGAYPLAVRGGSWKGGAIRMSGSTSSQFISGVLMALAHGGGGGQVEVEGGIVQRDYVWITIDQMRAFGAEPEPSADLSLIRVPATGYRAAHVAVEADASTATYFAALPAVLGGSIEIANLAPSTRQPDIGFLDLLERMGCAVERQSRSVTVSRGPGGGPLRGGFSVDMRPLSDATLTLAALAPFSDGPIEIRGVEHIRHHESDRIAAMCGALTALGIRVDEHPDGMTVHPGTPRRARLETHEDHRMAMSLALVGLAGDGVELLDPGCVAKTCPGFFDQLRALGAQTAAVFG